MAVLILWKNGYFHEKAHSGINLSHKQVSVFSIIYHLRAEAWPKLKFLAFLLEELFIEEFVYYSMSKSIL